MAFDSAQPMKPTIAARLVVVAVVVALSSHVVATRAVRERPHVGQVVLARRKIDGCVTVKTLLSR